MKYIIAGKSELPGIPGNDTQDLNKYFELGWEVVGSRIDLIRLRNTGCINQDTTTIVTAEDRKFMYQRLFKNVISWAEFKNTGSFDDILHDYPKAQDFLFLNQDKKNTFWEDNDPSLNGNKKYFRYNEDYYDITEGFLTNTSFLEKHIKENERFIVACIRFRDHCPGRNSKVDWWELFLKRAKETNNKVFVVGKTTEKFCDGKSVIHVEKLANYVSLIQHPGCKSVVAQSTGTALLAYSASKSKIYLVDPGNVAGSVRVNNAVMGGNCSVFTKADIIKLRGAAANKNAIEVILKEG